MKMNIRVKFDVMYLFMLLVAYGTMVHTAGSFRIGIRYWIAVSLAMLVLFLILEGIYYMVRIRLVDWIERELYMLKGYAHNPDLFTIQCKNIGKLIHICDKVRRLRIYNKRTGIDKYNRINAWIKNGRKDTTDPLILLYTHITDDNPWRECVRKEVTDAYALKATKEKRLEAQDLSTEDRVCAIAELKKETDLSISKSEQHATVENTKLAEEYWKLFVCYLQKEFYPSISKV